VKIPGRQLVNKQVTGIRATPRGKARYR